MLKELEWLKNNTTKEEFLKSIKDIEDDIKVNRIPFNKKTSRKEFAEICQIYGGILTRC